MRIESGRRSLVTRVIFVITMIAASVTLVVSATLFFVVSFTFRQALLEDSVSIADQIARSLGRPLYELSDYTAEGIADAYLAAGTLLGVRLESGATGVIVDVPPPRRSVIPVLERDISFDRFELGTVTLWFDDTELKARQRQLLISIGLVVLTMMVGFVGSVRLASRSIIDRHLDPVLAGIEHISSGDYEYTIPATSYGELDGLVSTLNSMSSRIMEKDQALRAANRTLETRVEERTRELEELVEKLRDANRRLDVAEKIMALGTLVTGVSHEINTPLGIAVTAASHIEAELARGSAGEVDREVLHESITLLRRNLERAAAVVAEFRNVAGNRMADEVERFNVADLIRDTVASLRPRLERHRVSVEITGDEATLRSYPGSLWPVVSNLVTNTLVHGHPTRPGGAIEIDVAATAAGVTIRYRDHGVGMDDETLRRVFEPFFTTRRGSGGMGLGMYVVYSSVVEKMQGSIVIASTPGDGVVVTIEVPSL